MSSIPAPRPSARCRYAVLPGAGCGQRGGIGVLVEQHGRHVQQRVHEVSRNGNPSQAGSPAGRCSTPVWCSRAARGSRCRRRGAGRPAEPRRGRRAPARRDRRPPARAARPSSPNGRDRRASVRPGQVHEQDRAAAPVQLDADGTAGLGAQGEQRARLAAGGSGAPGFLDQALGQQPGGDLADRLRGEAGLGGELDAAAALGPALGPGPGPGPGFAAGGAEQAQHQGGVVVPQPREVGPGLPSLHASHCATRFALCQQCCLTRSHERSREPAARRPVGYGLAGRSFHAPLIATTPGLRLENVVTANPERREQLSREYPQARAVDSVEQLLADPSALDLVVVASPNDTHSPTARAALEAGLPVVVDKPLAPTAAEARELIELAEARGVMLTVFQNRRWDSDFRTAKHLIAEGDAGRGAPLRVPVRALASAGRHRLARVGRPGQGRRRPERPGQPSGRPGAAPVRPGRPASTPRSTSAAPARRSTTTPSSR